MWLGLPKASNKIFGNHQKNVIQFQLIWIYSKWINSIGSLWCSNCIKCDRNVCAFVFSIFFGIHSGVGCHTTQNIILKSSRALNKKWTFHKLNTLQTDNVGKFRCVRIRRHEVKKSKVNINIQPGCQVNITVYRRSMQGKL